ncbi:peptidase T [Virgibacillus halodenitrificans]|uniref:peptidase T n=1 Tax=Virgibacillus halodenitrificans TaxID=1482 RepID=UPI001F1B7448|nr:peptidase T [Virgibacillus halodenitrificans]
MKQELVERFTTYVKIDTQSNEQIEATPSTEGQFILADLLVNELKEIGMEDVSVDEHAYVMATLPANTDKDIPTIGFLAHMDTATDFTGRNVNPQLIENYNGKDITLNEELNITLSTEKFPELSTYKGHTLITTDGTTLLGADNKAGITEIMTAMAYLINHPEIQHGEIRIAFTPDEEIGRGPHKFDVDRFNAEYAYTVDGGPLGELQYESFNAADARITFTGNSVHPGTAKNKLVNAARIAAAFINKFPEQETPEHTEQLEGFYHLISMEGDVERAEVNYIIRDFDRDKFAERKSMVEKLVDQIRKEYKAVQVELKITDEYYNMRQKIEPVKEVVDIAYQTMENLNIKPIVQPIRGGTDGSQLSYMGLPTPNIFTGGENFHGKYEYVSVDNMEKATQVIVEICELFAKQSDQ